MNRQLDGECPDLDPAIFGCHVIQVLGAGVIVCVHGDVDCATAPELSAFLDQQLGLSAQDSYVEVGLSQVSFLGARGITTLIAAAQTARVRTVEFRVTGCSARLLHLFDLVGVSAELTAISAGHGAARPAPAQHVGT